MGGLWGRGRLAVSDEDYTDKARPRRGRLVRRFIHHLVPHSFSEGGSLGDGGSLGEGAPLPLPFVNRPG